MFQLKWNDLWWNKSFIKALLNQTSTQTMKIHVYVVSWESIILMGSTNEIKPRSRLYYNNRKESLRTNIFQWS